MTERPVVVTGGGGTLGRALRRSAADVLALSRSHAAGCIQVDQLDSVTLADVLAEHRPRAIVHAAGRTDGTDAELWKDNVDLLRTVIEVAARGGVPVVAVGSAAEYGDPGPVERVSESAPTRPRSAYGRAKLAATEIVRRQVASGTAVTVARLFNVIALDHTASGPVGDFVRAIRALPAAGGPISVGNPAVVRDFVTDMFAAEALLRLTTQRSPQVVVNVCSGRGISFGELLAALAACAGRAISIDSRDEPAIMSVVGDPGLLRELTGLRSEETVRTLAEHALGRQEPQIE